MKHIFLFSFLSIFFLGSASAGAKIHTEAVSYSHGGVALEGYLAYEDGRTGQRPGILIFHEWKGLGDYVKKRAVMLAELGYVAFAADMYGKGVYAKDHNEAALLSGAFRENRELMRARAKAGLEVLRNHPKVDPENLAAIGYCFGGTAVLEMARASFDLKGVVSFHGSLSTLAPAEPGAIEAKVLVMHGANDKFVSPEVSAFEAEMKNSGADWQFVSFGGAVHSFTVPEAGNDPSANIAYHPEADRRSWQMMLLFFDEIFPAHGSQSSHP